MDLVSRRYGGALLGVLVALFGAAAANAVDLDLGSGGDYTREHVNMSVSSIRLCGSFPFYYPCVDVSYWLPKWMVRTKLLTVQSVDYTAGNAEAAGTVTGPASLHFFDVETVPAFLGYGTDTRDDFLQPCTRNNLCMGVPTPEASPGAFIDDFYFYKSGCVMASGGNVCRKDPCWAKETHLHVGAVGTVDWDRCANDVGASPGDLKSIGLFVAFNIPPPYPFGWGNALPRTGFVTHTSAGAASGLAALRAFNVARYPTDVWPQFGFMRTPVTHFNEDALKGPAPIGQPAMYPFVGPFPCMHLRPNSTTGLYWAPGTRHHGSDCFPAGVWLEDALGQPYDRAKKDAFDDANRVIRADNVRNGTQNPQTPENFDWVFWRFRKCTCPWPSPAALYAQHFEKQTGPSRNNCIGKGSVTAIAKDAARAAANTFRGLLRSGYQAAKTAANDAADTAAEATVGMIENVVGDAEAVFGTSGDSATVTPAEDDRGHLGRNAEGFREDTRGGHAETLVVRGAGFTQRDGTTWGTTSTTGTRTSSIGDAYEAGLVGSGQGSSVVVGAPTLGTSAAGGDGLFDTVSAVEGGRDKTATLTMTDGLGNVRNLPGDLYGVVQANRKDALTEGVNLAGLEPEPLDGRYWSGLDPAIGSLGGCRADDVLGGSLNSLDVVGHEYCMQAPCNGANAGACTDDVQPARNRCLGQKTAYEAALAVYEACVDAYDACRAAVGGCRAGCSCAAGTPPGSCAAQAAACLSGCGSCSYTCGARPVAADYPWDGPNPPGGRQVGFGHCSGAERPDLEGMGNRFCRRYAQGCCTRDGGGSQLEKSLGAGAAFIPGTGDLAEMGCQLVVGQDP